IQTLEPQNGADDTILGGRGVDRILGGNGGDLIEGNEDSDLILGGRGVAHSPTPDSGGVHPDLISTLVPNEGGADTIEGDEDNDIILGGTAGGVVWGNVGTGLV